MLLRETHHDVVSRFQVRTAPEMGFEVKMTSEMFTPECWDVAAPGTEPGDSKRRFVIISPTVKGLYGEGIFGHFDACGVTYCAYDAPQGEVSKTLATVDNVLEAMSEFPVDRRAEPYYLIGGGVVADIGGLAACLQGKGAPYVYVPTTFIGMIDAGPAFKRSVNGRSHGKNKIGHYYGPRRVTIVPRFLETLPRDELRWGMAEVFKMAVIFGGPELFELLESMEGIYERLPDATPDGDPEAHRIFVLALRGMLQEHQANPKERRLHRWVDHAHMVSGPWEMAALREGRTLTHGNAVALEIALMIQASQNRGVADVETRDRVLGVMRRLELPTFDPCMLNMDLLDEGLRSATRHRGGKLNAPVVVEPGTGKYVQDFTGRELRRAADDLAAAADAAPSGTVG